MNFLLCLSVCLCLAEPVPPPPLSFALSQSMLQRSVHNVWLSPRLSALQAKFAGPSSNLTLSVLGGSFSVCCLRLLGLSDL